MNNQQNFNSNPKGETLNLRSDFLKNCSDENLWKLFKDGHEGAFSVIYKTYFKDLCRFGERLGFINEEVEDTIQDLFIHLRKKRAGLMTVSKIKPFLFKCFRRELIRKSKKTFPFQSSDEDIINSSFLVSVSHETYLMEKQMSELQCEQLKKAINQLSQRQREAIYYFFFEGFSYKELADIMALNSSKTARNLVYKAITSLKNNKKVLPDWLIATFLMAVFSL